MADIAPNEFLLSSDELRHLLAGSYESLIARVETVVSENAENLFGEKTGTLVLGTFSGYAVVLSESGKLLRVKFEEKSGKVNLVEHKELDLPRVLRSDVGSLVLEDASKAVDLMLSGRLSATDPSFVRLVRMAGSYPKTPEQLVEAVIATAKAKSAWKTIYQEHSARIRRFLWGELMQIEDRRLRPKFQNLYNGSTPDEQLEGFREEVVSGLNTVLARLGDFSKLVESSDKSFGSLKNEFRDLGEDSLYNVVSTFSSDLLDDILRVRGNVEEMLASVTCVSCLAKLYDSLGEELYDFELASRFVNRIATMLRDSGEEGGVR